MELCWSRTPGEDGEQGVHSASLQLNDDERVFDTAPEGRSRGFELISYLNLSLAPSLPSLPLTLQLLILLVFTITYYKLTSAALFPN